VTVEQVLEYNTDTLAQGSPILAEYLLGLIDDAREQGYLKSEAE
jgi:hypothetical protein